MTHGAATVGNGTNLLDAPTLAAIGWAGRRLQLRELDAAGRPVQVTDGEPDGLTVDFGFSSVSSLTSITEPAGASPADVTLTYDTLGRLTGFLDAPTAVAIESYGYDATGNRTSFENLSGLQAYGYPVDSHRLASVDGVGRTYDAAGNTLTIGSAWTYSYGQAGRMATASNGTTLATYAYTGAGEQVSRAAGGSTTLFVYDEAGQLLGQYNGAGNPLQQYVWLETLPVGVIAGGTVYHVQPDHLGTPRAVIDPGTDTVIWSWSILGEAFGTTIPNEDPDGDSVPFVFDLRFPGQRFDRFSGLNQNYFRDYEPLTGRYPTSDPIGLEGGWSTYRYAYASPFRHSDPYGLFGIDVLDPIFGLIYRATGGRNVDERIANVVTGLGDGVFNAITFGIGDLAELREIGGIQGGIDYCSEAYLAGRSAGNVVGAIAGSGAVAKVGHKLYKGGREISFGNNFRIAPFGNRTGHPTGRLPHYHRRAIDVRSGQTRPGHGIGRHRPWDRRSTDMSFWERF